MSASLIRDQANYHAKPPLAVRPTSFLLPGWIWLGVVAAGHLLFVTLTVLAAYIPSAFRSGLFQAFNLASESNVAAWWSTVNLLALAVLAAEILRLGPARARPAWAGLSLLLALLSLDELGSLHERAGGFRELMPYIVGAVILLAFSLGSLFLGSDTRRASLWIGAGFALFGLVILQERIEHILVWPAWASGLRAGFEEGTELLGMSLILWGALSYRKRVTGGQDLVPPRPLDVPAPGLLLLMGLGLHILLTLTPHEQASAARWGEPGLWFPSAVFFVLALAAAWQAAGVMRPVRLPWLGLAILFLFSSVASVYLLSARPASSLFASLGSRTSSYFFVVGQVLATAVLLWFADRITLGRDLPALLLILGFVAAALFWGQPSAPMLLAGVTAVFLSWLTFRRDWAPVGGG
jgi:hypothetical protein